jgi:serine/threonine-protein kinase
MPTHGPQRAAYASSLRLPERYEPLRLIAAGGTASVWCAEDRMLGRRVAVKLLAERFAGDPEAVRRFKREARAAAHLSGHPNVVMIFDVGEITSPRGHRQPFMVMEHLAGGTVADAMRHGAVTFDDAVRWLYEAASAVDYAHANGILHRDIKPANLLLDCERVLHVADFGIAQIGAENSAVKPTHVLGTASYLPPERALGRPATRASDHYSLAVVAFELLTGQRPFAASSPRELARQHLEQAPPRASWRNPHLPQAIDAVLVRGLAKVPEHRWPSAQDFAAAVAHAMSPAVDVEAGRAAAVERARRVVITARSGVTRRRSSRRRARAGLLAGAVASLAVMGSGIVWIADPATPTAAREAVKPSSTFISSGPANRAPGPRRPMPAAKTHQAAVVRVLDNSIAAEPAEASPRVSVSAKTTPAARAARATHAPAPPHKAASHAQSGGTGGALRRPGHDGPPPDKGSGNDDGASKSGGNPGAPQPPDSPPDPGQPPANSPTTPPDPAPPPASDGGATPSAPAGSSGGQPDAPAAVTQISRA